MRRTLLGIWTLLALTPGLWADDPPKDPAKNKGTDAAQEEKKSATPAEQYRALTQEINKAQQEFMKEYTKLKTDAERRKLVQEKYPQPAKYAKRMMEIADKNPGDPAAVDALIYVVTAAGDSKEGAQAIAQLTKSHIDSPKMGQVASSLIYSSGSSAESLLRTILEKNTHKEVQAVACFSLGQRLKMQAEGPGLAKAAQEKNRKEAEELFERVMKEFADAKMYGQPIAAMAKGELFEMHNLAIGKKAPQIEGEDIDGQKFKLSDYQGKVVVLDFWGHW